MVCIVSLPEYTIALPNSTIVDRLQAPILEKGVVKNQIQNCYRLLSKINMPSVGRVVGFS